MLKIFYHLIPIVYEGGYWKEIYVKAEIQLFNFYLKKIYISKTFPAVLFFLSISVAFDSNTTSKVDN